MPGANPWPSRQEQARHARQRGRYAAQRGEPADACPYSLPVMRRAWLDGWREG